MLVTNYSVAAYIIIEASKSYTVHNDGIEIDLIDEEFSDLLKDYSNSSFRRATKLANKLKNKRPLSPKTATNHSISYNKI